MAMSLAQQPHSLQLPVLDTIRASSLPPLDRKRSFDLGSDRSLLNPESRSPSVYSQRLSDVFEQQSTPRVENKGLQLPGLAALASIASTHESNKQSSHSHGSGGLGLNDAHRSGASEVHSWRTPPPPPPFLFSGRPVTPASMNATVAPGLGAGQPGAYPSCQNCNTGTTPLWRRDDSGSILCNACGLFLKLHGRPRPISLKTDVIKSRNRVKVPSNQQQGQQNGQQNGSIKRKSAHGLAAAHPDIAHGQHNASSDPSALTAQPPSRTGTPSNYPLPPHPSNNVFDNSDPHSGYIASDGSFAPARNGSPRSLLLNGEGATDADLAEANERLKTRVSELEVINDLFRGRVAELEQSESEARKVVDELRARLDAFEHRDSPSGEQATVNSDAPETEDDATRDAKRRRVSEDQSTDTNGVGEAQRAAEIAAAAAVQAK